MREVFRGADDARGALGRKIRNRPPMGADDASFFSPKITFAVFFVASRCTCAADRKCRSTRKPRAREETRRRFFGYCGGVCSERFRWASKCGVAWKLTPRATVLQRKAEELAE